MCDVAITSESLVCEQHYEPLTWSPMGYASLFPNAEMYILPSVASLLLI